MMRPAISRGTTRYLIGLVDSVVRASICSVTRMVPISAAMAAPMRPATIRPASTGPSSRVSEMTDDVGDGGFGIEAGEAGIALQRQHHAGEDRGQPHHRQRVVADIDQLAADQAEVEGPAEGEGYGLQGEEGDAADLLQAVEDGGADGLQDVGHDALSARGAGSI